MTGEAARSQTQAVSTSQGLAELGDAAQKAALVLLIPIRMLSL